MAVYAVIDTPESSLFYRTTQQVKKKKTVLLSEHMHGIRSKASQEVKSTLITLEADIAANFPKIERNKNNLTALQSLTRPLELGEDRSQFAARVISVLGKSEIHEECPHIYHLAAKYLTRCVVCMYVCMYIQLVTVLGTQYLVLST